MMHGSPCCISTTSRFSFSQRRVCSIETSYQGAVGRDLASLFINVNQVPFEYALDGRNTQRQPALSDGQRHRIPTFSTAKSNYNAFNLRVEQRYRAGA